MDRRPYIGSKECCTRCKFPCVCTPLRPAQFPFIFHDFFFLESPSVAADKAVSGESKNPLDLIVVAQEIAASTAQLVVASRVKAPRDSNNLKALSTASKDVTQCTGAVVATAKDCSKRMEESQDLDLTKLTVHQAKTLEMEIQVKVLELEQAIQVERSRLAAFRRKNYREN